MTTVSCSFNFSGSRTPKKYEYLRKTKVEKVSLNLSGLHTPTHLTRKTQSKLIKTGEEHPEPTVAF
jgi:hypothetical protein